MNKSWIKEIIREFGWAGHSAKIYRGYIELCAFVFSIGPAGAVIGSLLFKFGKFDFDFIGISGMASAYLCASLLMHKRRKDTLLASLFFIECVGIIYGFIIVVPDELWIVSIGSIVGAMLGVIHGKELTKVVNRAESSGTRW